MSGTIDQAVERERDRKQTAGTSEKEDPRKGPGKTGPAQGSGIPDDDGEAASPNQPRSTPMAGKKP